MEIDYWWDKLTAKIVQLERKHQNLPEDLIQRYAQVSKERIKLGRLNETPL